MKYIITIALACLLGCAGSATERATTTLNALAAVINPASKLALKECNAQRADTEDESKLDAIDKRCEALFDELDRISALHEAAAEAVENGNVALAEQILAQVTKLWRDAAGAQ